MKLTPLAKAFIALVILAVRRLHRLPLLRRRDQEWSTGANGRRRQRAAAARAERRASRRTTSTNLGKAADPDRNKGVTGVTAANDRRRQARAHARRRHQHLGRPHAGHRLQRRPRSDRRASIYKTKYGLDVKFVLIEDPAAKLDGLHQGRHRHHVGHGRLVGARGVDAGRAEHLGQGDHPAGLVARRRRHRRRSRRSTRSRISRARRSRRRATRRRTGCSSICCRSRASRRTTRRRSRRTWSSPPRRRSRPPRSRPRRSTPR